MNDLDPAEAGSYDELIKCLKLLYTRADRPSLRELEQRTTHLSGKLPGTGLKRVRLGRSAVSEMLRGVKFPRKAFLLTFVEACGIDVAADRRWEEAWNRLAPPQLSQLAENAAQQARDTARSEIERLQADLATQTAELERTRAAAAHALEAARVTAEREATQLRKELATALAAQTQAEQARQLAETAARQARDTARSEIERLQADLATQTAELERTCPEATGSRLDAAIRRSTFAEKLLERELFGSGFVSVIMPQLGEGVTDCTVTRWLKKEGERVEVSEPLLEVSNGEGHTALITPVTGTVRAAANFLAGKTAAVGTVLAVIDIARDEAKGASLGRSVSVSMPQLGESPSEGTVVRWLKKEGERVEIDEPLMEVSTDKVDTEIPSPASGILGGIAVDEDETVAVGAQLAVIEPAPPRAITTLSVSMPRLGESNTGGTVVRWLKKEGERVEIDKPLLEVSTDKVDTDIPSPTTGNLRSIAVDEGEPVAVGAQLAVIEPAPYMAITQQPRTWPVRMPPRRTDRRHLRAGAHRPGCRRVPPDRDGGAHRIHPGAFPRAVATGRARR